MNLEKIKAIVNSGHPLWNELLIMELAKDEDVFNDIMKLLATERKYKKELITDLNLELSRADVHIRHPKLLKENHEFIVEEIDKFYDKYDGVVGHCFRNRKKEEIDPKQITRNT